MSKFSVEFPVRYYECDAYGHVNHANYVRYMIEAALLASTAVGYSQANLETMGHVWLAREHEIEYLRPVTYGDTVIVKTWVADFRRVRSLRRYEFWCNDKLVARASTDWVYVDKQTHQLKTIPSEVIRAFTTHNAILETNFERESFPKPAPYPAELFVGEYPIEWRDIDPQQHVNNAAYLAYIENCNTGLCAHFGWPMERMTAEGFGIIARRYRIQYLQAAISGETLRIATWLSNKKRATAIRHHEIRRTTDDILLVRSQALWVWVNLATGAPIRIPPQFFESFAPNFSH